MTEQLKQIQDQVNQGRQILDKLSNKDFGMYFFVMDTKGNPTAGVANIYEHVKVLNKLGYKACILHDKNDYKLKGDDNSQGIAEWMGVEYAELPHISIESQQLNVGPADFIFIPEVFSNIMDQVKGFPCKKVVFSQSYDYILELLAIGKRWNTDYGFNDVITTSEKQAIYVSNLFPTIRTHVVPVSIPSYFQPSNKPKLPIVTICTRNHGDAAKIAKSFYLQFPVYKWVTFKELRGISREKFATELGKSCLAVWIDPQSSMGTFPLEAIECETPVIAQIPNMVPEWMETVDGEGNLVIKNNGIYTNTTMNIPELIATYMKVWLEDSVPQDFTDALSSSKGGYSVANQITAIENVYFGLVENRKNEFQTIITNLENQAKQITE